MNNLRVTDHGGRCMVLPYLLRGDAQSVAMLEFTASDSPVRAVDEFGYGLMGLATLCVVPPPKSAL